MNLASLPDTILDGKYRIEQQLGKGGMGAVFRATHLGTTRTVAVKVIVPQLAGEDEFLLRFQREAEAAGRLRHANVVNVTDFGSARLDHGQLAYLVMEFLDGQNLTDFLKKNRRPAADEVLDILDQVALALDAAHENGIVHRDLKPDNIWLQPNHRGGFNVKVLDFGIAKLGNPLGSLSSETAALAPEVETIAPARPTLASQTLASQTLASPTLDSPTLDSEDTETLAMAPSVTASPSVTQGSTTASSLQTVMGAVLGTPAYMAPEQCQGRDVRASADIYSLSVIVYQMFCGCLPFGAETLAELLHKQIAELPTSPAARDPGISKRISEVIMSGLAKNPEDRPPSATAFAARLRAGTEGELKLLADGKVVANNYGNSFFALLLACFVPYLPIMAGLFLTMRALAGMSIVHPGVLVAALEILQVAVLFFLSQTYKAGATLLLRDAAEAGHFRQQWRPQFWKLVRGFPSLAVTHLRNAFDFVHDHSLPARSGP
jgi:serine/threonine protein kinase